VKNLFFTSFIFILFSCVPSKKVYWCGDHPCINKKEKEAYFKKTMIVEVRTLKEEDMKKNSEFHKITEQAISKQKKKLKTKKKLEKQAKLDEKRKLKLQKQIAKQEKLNEKRKLRNQKKLERQAKLEEKNKFKQQKKLEKLAKKKNLKNEIKKEIEIEEEEIKKMYSKKEDKGTFFELNNFDDLLKDIYKKNASRPYPDINDIPN